MNGKEFSKKNVLELIAEKRWQAEIFRNRAKTKKESEGYKGQIIMLDILECNIKSIWPDQSNNN